MRTAVPFGLATLLAALFPAAASAATATGAVGGGDFVTAVVIAGAGALVITLIMLAAPAARRGNGSSAPPTTPQAPSSPAASSPAPTPFRTHPASSPEGEADASAVLARAEPATERVAVRPKLPPAPTPAEPATERSAVAVADRPRSAGLAGPLPAPSSKPAPDLLSALAPAALLGDSHEPERLRESMARGPGPEAIGPDRGARALLRDHSLAVPLAACVLVGVTVHLVRAHRRRR